MKFVYVLENDGRFQRDIAEAISQIDPKIQVRLFSKLESFMAWFKEAMQEGPSSISKGGTIPSRAIEPEETSEIPQLVAVIAPTEMFHPSQFPLIKKTRAYFAEHGFCSKEDPTAFVLTAFDDPGFKISEYQNPDLANIIFKPFDKLILQQHLIHAIDGHHPASDYKVANIKTSARFEIMKEITMEAVSELGFVTVGDRSVELGSVSKYYSPMFATEKHKSIVGVIDRIEPHPEKEGKFRIWNRYFSLDPTQIRNLRLRVQEKTVTGLRGFDYVYPPTIGGEKLNCVIIDPGEKENPQFSDSLTRNYPNINLVFYNSWEEFLTHLDPPKKATAVVNEVEFPKNVVAIFMHHLFVGENLTERMSKVQELLRKKGSTPSIFVLSSEDYSDDKEREYAKAVQDIFYRPLDRRYIVEKISHLIPDLKIREVQKPKWIRNKDIFRAANPVQVVEFSEASFVIEYKREVEVGAFREILLWQPDEVAAPELLAICNFNEPSQGKKGIFMNHFVLFGMTDHFLKSIRIWIRNNHILSKAS